MIPIFRPYTDRQEEKAVAKVLKSGWLGKGPVSEKFENNFKNYTKAKFATSTTSATAALHLASKLAELGKGDEVVTTPMTFIATNQPILMSGAKPVFADIEYGNLCIDPQDIEKKITKKTKAIVVMHYGGHPCDMEKIVKICRRNDLILIEDCAHAMGSFYKNKHVGTFGDYACFSFGAVKNVTTGDGGMLVSKSGTDNKKAKAMSWSGISQNTWERSRSGKYKWKYNVTDIGWKYQMNDIAASIGLVQIKKLKKSNKLREGIANKYFKEFKDVEWINTPEVNKNVITSNHNYAIKVPANVREKLYEYLKDKGISTSVHYVPTHHYGLYNKFKNELPVTDKVWMEILLLPIFPDLESKNQEYIVDCIKKFKV